MLKRTEPVHSNIGDDKTKVVAQFNHEYNEAKDHENRGQFQQAARLYRELIANSQKTNQAVHVITAKLALASCCSKMGNHEEADHLLSEVKSHPQFNPRLPMFVKIQNTINLRKYDAGIIGPDQLEEARGALKDVAYLLTKDKQLYMDFARQIEIDLKQKKYHSVIRHVDEFLAAHPDDKIKDVPYIGIYYTNKLQALHNLKRQKEAQELRQFLINSLISITNHNGEFYSTLAISEILMNLIFARPKNSKIEPELMKLIIDHATQYPHPKNYLELINAYHINGEYDKAISAAKKSINKFPHFWTTYINYSCVLQNAGMVDPTKDLENQEAFAVLQNVIDSYYDETIEIRPDSRHVLHAYISLAYIAVNAAFITSSHAELARRICDNGFDFANQLNPENPKVSRARAQLHSLRTKLIQSEDATNAKRVAGYNKSKDEDSDRWQALHGEYSCHPAAFSSSSSSTVANRAEPVGWSPVVKKKTKKAPQPKPLTQPAPALVEKPTELTPPKTYQRDLKRVKKLIRRCERLLNKRYTMTNCEEDKARLVKIEESYAQERKNEAASNLQKLRQRLERKRDFILNSEASLCENHDVKPYTMSASYKNFGIFAYAASAAAAALLTASTATVFTARMLFD